MCVNDVINLVGESNILPVSCDIELANETPTYAWNISPDSGYVLLNDTENNPTTLLSQNPTISFIEPGSYTLSLSVTTECGTDTHSQTINVLGNPHTKSIDDENLWFYFDRKLASGKLVKFGDMDLLENNVLILNFDKYGIVIKKEFFSKEDMKKIKYSEMKTENPVSQDSFVTSFLQSVRQKMYGKRKF